MLKSIKLEGDALVAARELSARLDVDNAKLRAIVADANEQVERLRHDAKRPSLDWMLRILGPHDVDVHENTATGRWSVVVMASGEAYLIDTQPDGPVVGASLRAGGLLS